MSDAPVITRSLLLVEDDPSLRALLARSFAAEGFAVTEAADGESAFVALNERSFDAICTDLWMSGASGLEVARRARQVNSEALVFIMTAEASTQTAIQALREGVVDYIEKPLHPGRVARRIRDTLRWRNVEAERRDLRRISQELEQPGEPARDAEQPPLTGAPHPRRTVNLPLVGQHGALREAMQLADRYARSDLIVLITGETGVGKDVFARYIHSRSHRAARPFVSCNLSAIPETLVESELFGHVKGAFTGADKNKQGYVEAAEGGTLFLDEIGDLPLRIQLKLLRFLETREYFRVGESTPRTANVRFVAATNVMLESAIRDRFREDLYYRLNSARIILPPLRERRDDILPLCEAFLEAATRPSAPPFVLSEAVKTLFLEYPWRGNVRELRNAIESAVLVATGSVITVADLPMHLQQYATRNRATIAEKAVRRIEQVEQQLVEEALAASGGDREAAARYLGVSVRTFYRKLARSKDGA